MSAPSMQLTSPLDFFMPHFHQTAVYKTALISYLRGVSLSNYPLIFSNKSFVFMDLCPSFIPRPKKVITLMSQGASISPQFPFLSLDKQTCIVFVLDTHPRISSSRVTVWRPDLQWPRPDCRGALYSLGDTGLSPATQNQ